MVMVLACLWLESCERWLCLRARCGVSSAAQYSAFGSAGDDRLLSADNHAGKSAGTYLLASCKILALSKNSRLPFIRPKAGALLAYQTRFEVYVWAPTRPAAERPRRRPISKVKNQRRRVAVFRVVADGRQHGRQRSRMACRAGARALISEATRQTRARPETRARGAHNDAPPLPPPRRRALPQMPRVLLVRGHREKTAMCWSRVK